METIKETASKVPNLASYEPKTPLGRELLEIRKKITESDEPMLDWEGVQREVSERRGGYESAE